MSTYEQHIYDHDDQPTLEYGFDRVSTSELESIAELTAPHAELSDEHVEQLLDVNVSDVKKLSILMPMLKPSNKGYGGFRAIAKGLHDVDEASIWIEDNGNHTRTAQERLLDAGTQVASAQKEVADYFSNTRFSDTVDDDTWDMLSSMDILSRADQASEWYQLYEEHEAGFVRRIADPSITSLIKPTELSRISQLPVDHADQLLAVYEEKRDADQVQARRVKELDAKAETEVLKLLETDGFSLWMEENGIDPLQDIDNLSSTALLQRTRQNLADFNKGQTARPVIEKTVDAAPQPRSEPSEPQLRDTKAPRARLRFESNKRAFGVTLEVSMRKPSVTAKDAAKNKSIVTATVATGIVAVGGAVTAGDGHLNIPKAITRGIDGMEHGSKKTVEHKNRFPLKGEPGLSADAPNPAVLVKPAGEQITHALGLEADEIIPMQSRKAAMKLAYKTAQERTKAIVSNKVIWFNEPEQTRMDRSQPIVRRVDELVHSILNDMPHNHELTATDINNAVELAVKAMVAARVPGSSLSASLDYKPTDKFQNDTARALMTTTLRGEAAYSVEEKRYIAQVTARFIDDAIVDKKDASALHAINKANKAAGEIRVINPEFTLEQILAGNSYVESGPGKDLNPAEPNWAGYVGAWQFSPDFWPAWAKLYLGNENADIGSIDNQVMLAVQLWSHNIERLGSIEAASAEWLKGPTVGAGIASHDPGARAKAISEYDGNHTTVGAYMAHTIHQIKITNPSKQMPYLKDVMARHPHFDWSMLHKKYPAYSYGRMHDLRHEQAEQIRKKHLSHEREDVGLKVANIAKTEVYAHLHEFLETQGFNKGPVIDKYSNGKAEAYCADFVSWVFAKAGYSFGHFSRVSDILEYFDKHEIHYRPDSKDISPQPGDIVVYSLSEHVGIVVAVHGRTLVTAESNTSDNTKKFNPDGGYDAFKTINYKKYPGRLDLLRLRDPR